MIMLQALAREYLSVYSVSVDGALISHLVVRVLLSPFHKSLRIFGAPLRTTVSLSAALKAVVSRCRPREATGCQCLSATSISTKTM